MLLAWGQGDEAALHQMIPLVQRELHQIARRCMAGEQSAHSLQPTALVNEAYLRLVEVQQMNWQNRAHFLAMAARLMRRILVDHARSKGSEKRGGAAMKISSTKLSSDLRSEKASSLDDARNSGGYDVPLCGEANTIGSVCTGGARISKTWVRSESASKYRSMANLV